MIQDHDGLRAPDDAEIDPRAITYTSERLGGLVGNVGEMLDYLCALALPNYLGTFATPADLPASADVNDYAFVTDDGDGKSAGYLYVNNEGVKSWVKRLDVDWSKDSILSEALGQTLPLYVFIGGQNGGQVIAGGANDDENLTLKASQGTGGNILLDDTTLPTADNSIDFGATAQRIKDIFIAGLLSDGATDITIAQAREAYDHLPLANNPHSVQYDQLTNKLGTVTVQGDVSGSVDLSTSGDKTLDLIVADDSHNHTSAFITDLLETIWARLKAHISNGSEVTYAIDELGETITPSVVLDTSRITDVPVPVSGKILAGNEAGDAYEQVDGTIQLTGDVEGAGSYDPVTKKVSVPTTVKYSSLKTLTDVQLDNFSITAAIGNPATITSFNHGLPTGAMIRIYGSNTTPSIDGIHTITKIDNDKFSLPVEVTASGSAYYIPAHAQLLFNATTGLFEVRKEFAEISHNEIAGLTDDDHAQYAKVDGRAGGQTIQGGTGDSEDLVLDSTSSLVKGFIKIKQALLPFVAPTYSAGWTGIDLGSLSMPFRNIFLKGEAFGLRPENTDTLPTASGTEVGRTIFNKPDTRLYSNNGTSYDGYAKVAEVPTELNDLSDVDTTTAPTEGQALLFDEVSSTFKPQTIEALPTGFSFGEDNGDLVLYKGATEIFRFTEDI